LRRTFPIGAIDLGPLQTVEQLVQTISSGAWGPQKLAPAGPVTVPDSARTGPFYGVVPQLRRPLSILDLLPTSPMSGKSFDYLQETGEFDYAAETADLQLKPEGGIGLTEAEVVARVIANWIKFSRTQIADLPALQQTIQNTLMYSVLRRLEGQVLAGDGQGENILSTCRCARPCTGGSRRAHHSLCQP
jgi:hypothetical protein